MIKKSAILFYSETSDTTPVKVTKTGRKVKIPEKLKYNYSKPSTQTQVEIQVPVQPVNDEFVNMPSLMDNSVEYVHVFYDLQ